MTWVTVELGDVARLQAGYGFPVRLQGRISGDYPFAKVGDISRSARQGQGELDSATNYVDQDDLPRLKAKPVPAGSVLFAKIGEAIRQNYRVVNSVPVLIDNNAMAAIPTARINGRYLLRFLQSLDFYQYASSTTVPALRKSSLEQIKVPLPPLPEQRRIAAILDHADTLRTKRRAADSLLGEITEALFRDSFDPDCEDLRELGEVADIQGGLQVSTSARSHLDMKVPYLRVANVMRGHLDLSEIKTIGLTQVELVRTQLQDDDLLVVEGHGNPSEIGRVGMWGGQVDGPVVHQNHLIRVRCRAGVLEPSFAMTWLNSSRGRGFLLRSAKTTSGLNTISSRQVKAAPIMLPSWERQVQFAEQLQSLNYQRAKLEGSMEQMTTLFMSLQSRAFRGEL